MFMRKTSLAIAVASVASLGASSVLAVDFNTTASVQSTLAVTVVNEFDIGTLFATETAENYVAATTPAVTTGGVGAVTIAPDGTTTDLEGTADGDPALTSLGTPVPAQGSVDMVNGFTLQLPPSNNIDASEFPGNANLINIAGGDNSGTPVVGQGIPLIHESNNPDVARLFMMHFRVEAVSGGTVASAETDEDLGRYTVTPAFGETTFVFNIGATITTEPHDGGAGTAKLYQEGLYSGTFEVTAAY